MLRISGMATVADKAERSAPRRVVPVEDLRQRYQDQEGSGPRPPPGVNQAPFGWMATTVQSRLAQLQNLLDIGRLPSAADQIPPRPVRRREGADDLRAAFLQGDGPHVQPSQGYGYQENQAQSPPGILHRNRPGRDLRVRFAGQGGLPPGRQLRRRPRFNDLTRSYQADPDDYLAL